MIPPSLLISPSWLKQILTCIGVKYSKLGLFVEMVKWTKVIYTKRDILSLLVPVHLDFCWFILIWVCVVCEWGRMLSRIALGGHAGSLPTVGWRRWRGRRRCRHPGRNGRRLQQSEQQQLAASVLAAPWQALVRHPASASNLSSGLSLLASVSVAFGLLFLSANDFIDLCTYSLGHDRRGNICNGISEFLKNSLLLPDINFTDISKLLMIDYFLLLLMNTNI